MGLGLFPGENGELGEDAKKLIKAIKNGLLTLLCTGISFIPDLREFVFLKIHNTLDISILTIATIFGGGLFFFGWSTVFNLGSIEADEIDGWAGTVGFLMLIYSGFFFYALYNVYID